MTSLTAKKTRRYGDSTAKRCVPCMLARTPHQVAVVSRLQYAIYLWFERRSMRFAHRSTRFVRLAPARLAPLAIAA